MKNKLFLAIAVILVIATIYFAACAPDVKANIYEGQRSSVMKVDDSNTHRTVDTQRININGTEYMIFAQFNGGVQVITLDKLKAPDTFSVPPVTKVSLVRQDSETLPISPRLIGANSFTDILGIFETNLLNLQTSRNAGDVLELTAAQTLELIALRSRIRRIDAQITDIMQNNKLRGIYQ